MSGRWMRNGFIYLLVIVAVMAIFFTLFGEPLGGGSREVPVSEVISLAARGQLELIEVSGDKLEMTTTGGERLTSRKRRGRAWWRCWSERMWTLCRAGWRWW